ARAPNLGPAQEEALVGREPVNLLTLLELLRLLESLVSDGETADVGEVLAHGQLAVYVHRIEGHEGIVLLAHHVSLGVELLIVLLGPPVA
nr:hypothetical protein [Tanacetum cinerariifolium]